MKFLSDEWITHPAFAEVAPVDGGFDGSVLAIVTGGPDGEVRFVSTFAGGRPAGATPGTADGWVASLTLTHRDARAVLDGEADLNALFMSGRMKVAGDDTAPLLDLLRATQAPAFREALAALAAATD